MKIFVDFPIFESPTSAYGNVSGYIDSSALPSVGDLITVVDQGMGGREQVQLKVVSITPVTGLPSVYGLEEVFCKSRAEAIDFVRAVEERPQLRCDVY